MNLKKLAALSFIVPGLAIQLHNPAHAYATQDSIDTLSTTVLTLPKTEAKTVSQKQVTKITASRALECYLAGGSLGECLYWDIFLR